MTEVDVMTLADGDRIVQLRLEDASPELVVLYDRVVNGIRWLAEHDPDGSFHVWFESGIRPTSPMPGQEEGRRPDYKAYFDARNTWNRLYRRLEQKEREEAASGQAAAT